MGEVYRARETRLARFEREARALTTLFHPNIFAIHDFGLAEEIIETLTQESGLRVTPRVTVESSADGGRSCATGALDCTGHVIRTTSAHPPPGRGAAPRAPPRCRAAELPRRLPGPILNA